MHEYHISCKFWEKEPVQIGQLETKSKHGLTRSNFEYNGEKNKNIPQKMGNVTSSCGQENNEKNPKTIPKQP